MYVDYLKEFWYKAEVEEETKTITFLLSWEVNVDDTADKSLSRAFVQPVTRPKAPTDLKTKKKRIPPSSKPKSPYKVRVILPKKQVVETQHAKVTVATTNATKSLVASELAEEQGNQPSGTKTKKITVLDQNIEEEVKDDGFVAMEEDEINITPKDAKEGEASKSLSGLRFMPDDDLASVFGFETQDSADLDSQESTAETFHASADEPAQSDPFDSIKIFVLESIAEELPQVDAQSQRFVSLQKELSKSLHTKMRKSTRLKDLQIMFKDMVSLLEAAEVFKTANADGEKWEKNNLAEEQDAQHPNQANREQNSGANTDNIVQREQPSAHVVLNEEKALVVHNPEEKKLEGIISMEDDSDEDDLDNQPL
ncbi:hypothetical protein Tco_0561464 [Tanacetum coccineum]